MGLQDIPSREGSNSWMTSLHKINEANNDRLTRSNVTGSNKLDTFSTPAPDTNKPKISLACLRARMEEQNKNEDDPQQENFVAPKLTVNEAAPPSNTPFSPKRLISSDARNFRSPEPITSIAYNTVPSAQPD